MNNKSEKQSGKVTPNARKRIIKNETNDKENKVIINKNIEDKSIENKEMEKEKKKNIIIPLSNEKGSNSCFINVLIQILFHSPEFNDNFLKLKINDENNPLHQLQILFMQYLKYQDSEPLIINIKKLRKSLSKIFSDIQEGVAGDPVEILNHILNAIHLFSFHHAQLNYFNPSEFNCNLSCISHKLFSIKLQENISCEKCEVMDVIPYDGNFFVYGIFVFELLEELHSKTNQSFRNKLFDYSKIVNNKVPEGVKVSNCKCEKPKLTKNLIQCGNTNPYLVINLIWDNYSPKMTDICKIYNLISIEDNNNKLFTLKDESKMNQQYYLYGIILFYNWHYTCAINTCNNWYFVDDQKIKKFQSYKDLIINVIQNHYHPVVLFYSIYKKTKEIDINEVFHSEDYNRIFKFCYNYDTQIRGEKVSSIISNKSINKSVIARVSSNKVDKSIERNHSKKGSKLSYNSLISNNEIGRFCTSCKTKNPINNIKCKNCNRILSILPISNNSSNNFNILKDTNISKLSNSGILKDIPIVNSINLNNNSINQNLRYSIEGFFDKITTSVNSISKSIKKNNEDEMNYLNECVRNNKKIQLDNNRSNSNIRDNNFDKNNNEKERNDNTPIKNNIDNSKNNPNNTWYCVNCSKTNDNNYCPKCGRPRS